MKIKLIGQRNEQGIGNHYACFADEIQKIRGMEFMVEEIDFQNYDQTSQAIDRSQPDDINICFVAANTHEHFRGHNIQWIVGESTRVPEHIMAVLNPAEQVWVPSVWGQQVLIDNGLAKSQTRVVIEGVDSYKFHPYGRSHWTVDRPFRFLILGKYEERKSIDETLQAFARAFGNAPEVELIIKSNYFSNAEQKYQDLANQVQSLGLENVRILWGSVNSNEVADLYRSCDVFVFPTKGEGWGLPLIEAAACGMPIITVLYSGHTEFLQHIPDSVIPVDYVMMPITCPEYKSYYPDSTGNWGNWARPDPHSLADAMKLARRNYLSLSYNARKNSKIIRNRFSWAQSVDQALAVMGSIAGF
jgi:glycosyltransferase involved in cell wall biosynthesis